MRSFAVGILDPTSELLAGVLAGLRRADRHEAAPLGALVSQAIHSNSHDGIP